MKTRILFLVLINMIFVNISLAQILTQEEKQQIINQLANGDIDFTIKKIINNNIVEAIPVIENIFWKKNHWEQYSLLRGLQKLNAPRTKEFAYAYIDSADKVENYNPLILKVEATNILFKLSDYSTAHFIFELLDSRDQSKFTNSYDLLPEVIKHVPQYAERAKIELFKIANISPYNTISFYALKYIEELYGNESVPIAVKRFMINDDKDGSSRMLSLEILWKYKYIKLDSLLKIRIYTEPYGTYREEIAGYILGYYTLSNYYFIKKYNECETNDLTKSLINYRIEEFRPAKLDPTMKIENAIDTLNSYVHQSNFNMWIDNNFSDSLINNLQTAKLYLNKNDFTNCAKQINNFQNKIIFEYRDSLKSTPSFITEDAWKFLYYYSGYILNRLPSVPQIFNLNIVLNGNGTVEKSPSQTEYDSSSTVTLTAKPSPGYIFKEWTGDITGTNPTASVVMNSNKNITALFIPSPSGAKIKLINSSGALLTRGTLQYYEGAWKDAVNNSDGTFTVNTTKPAISLRMTYEYGSQTKQNVPVGNGDIVFQTVNAQVQLKNSLGELISDQGTVQYYAGAWRTFGTTSGGIASKELLPGNYSFRMTYGFASKDMQQDISSNAVVTFRTVKTQVQLKNSQGAFMDQGTVQYYAGAWRSFGVTSNGTASLELLPNNYSFRMTYAFSSTDKQQDIGNNSTVVFQTVNAAVQLQNSKGELIDRGSVQYYAGAWREFGTTTNGTANKELLPNNYSFRMIYEYSSSDKQQNLFDNPTVVFKTINAQVQLKNSLGSLINDQAAVQYYAGAWRVFGNTSGGISSKELLAGKYSFRITYAFASKDLQQDITTNPVVTFQTVKALVQLKNSQGSLIDQGTVQYYSGAWRSFGVTSNGTASMELLPNNYSFRMTYEYVSVDKQQDIGTDNTIGFSTILCTVRVKDAQGSPVNNAQVSYYSGAWRLIGSTVSGEITKELLPSELSFRAKLGTKQMDVKQNLTVKNLVEIALP